MTDLERIFHQIVVNLTATDPARLHRPLPLGEIRDSIVAYRANRRALQIESSEDYEVALMRLCAGEGGLASIDPPEAQTEFASELASPNPDLTIIQRHEKALLSLDPGALARALDSDPHRPFAPRESVTPADPAVLRPEKASPVRAKLDGGDVPHCSRCGSALPTARVVNFCPQCGQNLTRRFCPQCNTELEPGWKHCVSCGLTLK